MMQNDLFKYPYEPASRPVDTSQHAAQDMKSIAATIRIAVLNQIKFCGSSGMTSRELSATLKMSYEAVQPRTSELKKMGLIKDSGNRRQSRAEDKQSIVWVMK